MVGMIDIPEGTCICSVCGDKKDNSHFSFYRHRINQNGEKAGQRLRVNTNCKECSKRIGKEKRLIEKGLKHLKPQAGSPCPSCGRTTQKFEFDHCHDTGVFRGYICKDCNVGFGKFGDTPRGLLNGLKYLLKSLPNTEEKTALLTEITDIAKATLIMDKYET